MRHIRNFMAAVMVAAMLAGGMTLGSATVEARAKKGGGDSQAAKCAYFEKILAYPYLTQSMRDYIYNLWLAYGCDQL